MQTLTLRPKITIAPAVDNAVDEMPKERTLRPYQEDLKKEVYKHYKEGVKSVLIVAGGGLGKTTVAAWIMRDRSIRAKRPARSIFLVERNCLLEQAANTLNSLGVDCSIIQGTRKVKWDHPCMVASLQTLRSWHDRDPKLLQALDMAIVLSAVLSDYPLTPLTLKILANIPNEASIKNAHDGGGYLHKMLGKVGMFILDEAHDGVGQKIYQTLFDIYSADDRCVFLGLTASPWRMSKEEWLGRWYGAKVESLQPPEAIKAGWVANNRIFNLGGVFDLSKVGSGDDGDYSDSAMAIQAMRPEALSVVVNEWNRLGENKPTLVFCANNAQSKAQSQAFNDAGITSEVRSGKTSANDRIRQDLALKNGTLKILCSVGTMTKGYDNPCIACVVFVKGTKSKSGFFQAAWRGNRMFVDSNGVKKQYYILMDFGGNKIHGNPMGCHDYDISEPRIPKRSDDPAAMIKDCPECGEEVSIFAKVCKCGHEFGDKFDDEQEELFDPSLYTLKEWFDPIGCEQIQYLRTEKRRCYNANENPQVAVENFQKRFGYIPPNDWHQWAVLGKRANKAMRQQFTTYLEKHAPHAFWIKIQLLLETGYDDREPPKFLAQWNQSWWDVLGVSKMDDKVTVKAAYLALSKQWHPDTCEDKENAKTQMQILNKAWEEYRNEQRN
jgi:superfamily II DNA or RNA helicase